jgi:hypothetical protein
MRSRACDAAQRVDPCSFKSDIDQRPGHRTTSLMCVPILTPGSDQVCACVCVCVRVCVRVQACVQLVGVIALMNKRKGDEATNDLGAQ